MARACGFTGKMAPSNWLATRLWSSAKPIESRRREAPMTAIERGAKMASSPRRGSSRAGAPGAAAAPRSGSVMVSSAPPSWPRVLVRSGRRRRGRQHQQGVRRQPDEEGGALLPGDASAAGDVPAVRAVRAGRRERVAVDLHAGPRGDGEDDLLHGPHADVAAPRVPAAHHAEDEGEGGGAAAAVEGHQLEAPVVGAGARGHAKAAAVVGD